MSKVTIAGDVNGTGVFTIAAPNGNTNRTLTLPDEAGTILTTATAGVPVNGPAFSTYQSSAQSLSPSVWTKMQPATEEFDTNSNYDNATNYRFTPTIAGYYQINSSYLFNYIGSSTYLLGVAIYKNGSQFKVGSLLTVTSPTDGCQTMVSALVYLNGSTDYVEIYCLSTAASAMPIIVLTLSRNYFQASMVRAA